MRFVLLSGLCLITLASHAQTRLADSLNKKIHQARSDKERLKAIIAYTDDYYNIAHDSLSKYAAEAKKLAAGTKDTQSKIEAAHVMACDYIQWGWTDSAYATADTALMQCDSKNSLQRPLYFKLTRIKAVALGSERKLTECMDILYKLLPVAEQYHDTIELAIISNTLSFIAAMRDDVNEGIKWNNRALSYRNNIPPGRLGSIYITRANIYYRANKTDSALLFVRQGIAYCKQGDYIDRMIAGYRLESALLTEKGDFVQAEQAIRNMIDIRQKLNHQDGYIIEDHLQIADFYAGSGQLQKAIDLCRKMLAGGPLTKDKIKGSVAANTIASTQLPYYIALAGYLKEAGDTKGYVDALEHIVLLKDSVSMLENEEAIAEMQTKYAVQEKEKTILSQELELTRRNTLLYGSIALILMGSLIAWLTFRNLRIRQREKTRLAIEEEKRQATQAIIEAEEKERKRIAADLHDNIGGYAVAIKEDVNRIESGNIHRESFHNLKQHTDEILNSLRDTIWVLNKEELTITDISDRFKNYAGKLMPAYPHIQILTNERIETNISISSRNALNIFRIMQEALHNALRHSGADTINIEIISGNKLTVIISDNGTGLQNNNTTGNGLVNMKARAKDIDMTFLVSSDTDRGTTITLSDTPN